MNLKNRLTRFLGSGLLRDLSTDKAPTHTRTISPKLGILGLFGFLGFYYEGKMSNTLVDERFQSNAYRAEAAAHKTALSLVLIIPLVSMSVLRLTAYHMLAVMIAVVGLAFGLSIFLQQYLLYRFENRE